MHQHKIIIEVAETEKWHVFELGKTDILFGDGI